MKIKKLLDSLDLIYYEYNPKSNIIKTDPEYNDFYSRREFTKITFYLSKEHIPFDVLKDKSILVNKKNTLLFRIKHKLSTFIENFKNSRKNIYLLSDKKIKWAKNIPLFEIEHIKQEIIVENYDAIVFTSKNAIEAIESFNKNWKKIPCYVISSQSAKLVRALNGKLEFIGKEKHGNEFAYELVNRLKNKKVLYLRGEKVVSKLISIFKKNDIDCTDVVVYRNNYIKPRKKIVLPKGSKIIFSSPSTIEYFFKNFDWDDSFHAISIGKTTAKYFPEEIKPVFADDVSLESCVKKALELD